MMMKYEITQMLLSRNRSGKALDAVGIVCHETANPGATALNHFRYFNGGDRKASAHGFVDWEQIIQTIPWTEKAWHAGPTANNRYIGIELCRPKSHDPAKFAEVWKRGVWLQAYLFAEVLKIGTADAHNLLSHDDCRRSFGDTTHTDPVEFFEEYGKNMDDFRRDVQTEIRRLLGEKSVKRATVMVAVLNVRKEPDSAAKLVAQLKRGDTVDILEEVKGWYRIGENRWISALFVDVRG